MDLILGLIGVALLGGICFGIPLWLLNKIPPPRIPPTGASVNEDMYGGFGPSYREQSYGSHSPSTSDAYQSFSDGSYDTSVAGE